MPVASGGIHAGQMHQLLTLFGDDVVLQFGAARSATRPASRRARSPTASRSKRWSRRATKARHRQRRAGRPQRRRQVVQAAAQALDTWKDVSFNYTSTDTPDFAVTATAS